MFKLIFAARISQCFWHPCFNISYILFWYYHYPSSVKNMLRELEWSTLEQRRNQASLTMLHKIHNKQVNVDHSHLTTTRNNKFLIPHSKTKHYMNSFFPQAIQLWNELLTEIKDAPTVQVTWGLHLQVDWTSFMLLIDVLIELFCFH